MHARLARQAKPGDGYIAVFTVDTVAKMKRTIR